MKLDVSVISILQKEQESVKRVMSKSPKKCQIIRHKVRKKILFLLAFTPLLSVLPFLFSAPMITQKSRGCFLMLTFNTSQTLATGYTRINLQTSSAPSSPSFSLSCLQPAPEDLSELRSPAESCGWKFSSKRKTHRRWTKLFYSTHILHLNMFSCSRSVSL